MTIHDAIRRHLYQRAGLVDPPKLDPRFSYQALARTEWSDTFETLMRNRLIIGALRYGLLGADNKSSFNRIASIRKRLDAYEKTGNLEYLVDSANLCLCEFVDGKHPTKHLTALDEHNYHVKRH